MLRSTTRTPQLQNPFFIDLILQLSLDSSLEGVTKEDRAIHIKEELDLSRYLIDMLPACPRTPTGSKL